MPDNYLKGSPPLSNSTSPSPPPVLGEVGLRGFLILTAEAPGLPVLRPLLDLASKSLTVSLTRDLGLGGSWGLTGDLTGGLTGLVPPAEAARWGDPPDRMESLSSSLLGSEMGLGILDFPDLLVLPLLASLVGVETQELTSHKNLVCGEEAGVGFTSEPDVGVLVQAQF